VKGLCRFIPVLSAGLVAAVLFGDIRGSGVINDAVIFPPDYDTFQPPSQAGGSYIDPAFGTRIVRVTECQRFGQDVLGGYFGNSEICFFNVDGSYFIAVENEIVNGRNVIGTFLYNGISGARVKMIGQPGDNIQPYWIRWALADHYKGDGSTVYFDPVYHFYKYESNEIRLYDVRDIDNYAVLRRFDEYSHIGPAGGEGDLSDDGRYWCLDGDSQEMFVYDLIDDVKYPVSTFDVGSLGSKGTEVGVDYAAVSTSGQYVVVAWGTAPAEGERYHGIEVYDKQWNFLRQIHPGIIHWELGVDAYGHEVIYTVASFGFQDYFEQRGVRPGDIISIRLSDGYIRLLKSIPKWSGFSMTGCNSVTGGQFIYVSYEARSENPEELWYPFWGEIIEVPTDGSGQVRRLAHHRTRPVEGQIGKYWQPDANINRQGTKIMYRSTYNTCVGDVFMFDITPRDVGTTDTTPPLAPMNLHSPSQGLDFIELSWEGPPQAADGDTATFYRIYRDNDYLAETFSTHYRDAGLHESRSYNFRVHSVDEAGLESEEGVSADFATLSDTQPPSVRAAAIENLNSVTLRFSEMVTPESAGSIDNYYFDQAVAITGAELLSDSLTVMLTTSALELGVEYTLHVSGIEDQSLQHNPMPGDTVLVLKLLADFFEDFESGLDPCWQLLNPERWSLVEGIDRQSLSINTSSYDSPGGKLLGEYALISGDTLLTRSFRLSCLARSGEDVLANAHADYAVLFSYIDALNYSYLQIHPYSVSLHRIENGERTIFLQHAHDNDFESVCKVGLEAGEDSVRVFLDDELIYPAAFAGLEAGQIGLGSYNDAVMFDNVNIENRIEADSSPPASPTGLQLMIAR